jgi:hypothetical protein
VIANDDNFTIDEDFRIFMIQEIDLLIEDWTNRLNGVQSVAKEVLKKDELKSFFSPIKSRIDSMKRFKSHLERNVINEHTGVTFVKDFCRELWDIKETALQFKKRASELIERHQMPQRGKTYGNFYHALVDLVMHIDFEYTTRNLLDKRVNAKTVSPAVENEILQAKSPSNMYLENLLNCRTLSDDELEIIAKSSLGDLTKVLEHESATRVLSTAALALTGIIPKPEGGE